MSLGLFHILDCNEANGPKIVVDDDKALDLVPPKEISRLGLTDTLADRDKALVCHQRFGRGRIRALKPHVAVGENAHQAARSFGGSTTGKPEM